MTLILFQRGATNLGFQVGRAYLNLRYPRFWLYSSNRATYVASGQRCLTGPNRGWLYAAPAIIGWERG